MSLLFVDGFDHYATADITKKWTTKNGGPTIIATAGRRGGGALRSDNGSAYYLNKSIVPVSSVVIGFAMTFTAWPSNAAVPLVDLIDGATSQCDLRLGVDGKLSVTRAGTALTGGTSTLVLGANAYHYIEWKVTIADSIAASSCVVKVDGAVWITVATGQDTKNTANTTANLMKFGTLNSVSNTPVVDFDDFYLCDQAGPAPNNDFLGDCRIDPLFPNADGSNSAWTPSTGTTHYTLVDETTPNTTDYVESNVVGNKDTWNFQDLITMTGIIYGVQACSAVLKDDAGGRSFANTVKSGATNADGASQALSTSQLYYLDAWPLDPNTGAAWTETNLNAAEFGVKVAA